MKIHQIRIFILLVCTGVVRSLFVPEQLPTLLSFLYTNIPPVRKGIDSRVGFGFRVGPNADFQVVFELGPQQNTAPLGPNGGNTNANTNKRETIPINNNPSWLQLWKQQANGETANYEESSNNIPTLDEDVVNHLKQLYKEQPRVVTDINATENKSNDTVEV